MLAYNQFQELQKSSNIAGRYRLEQIQYIQRSVFSHLLKQTEIVNNLAAVLAVLVKWEYTAVREYQGALADLVTELCQPTKNGIRVSYSKRQIEIALKTLQKLGYLIIPRQLTRQSINQKHSKIYFFHSSFNDLLEYPKDEKVSHISPPSRVTRTFKGIHPTDPVNSVTPCFNSNKCHAPEVINNIETPNPRVKNIKNIPETRERTTPQKIISSQQNNITGKPIRKDLKKIQRQVLQWISGCQILSGQKEAISLAAKFLEHQNADPVVFWVSRWPRLLNSEKSHATRQIIKALRNISPAPNKSKPYQPAPESTVQVDTVPVLPPDFDVEAFLAGLLLDKPYTGPGQTFIKRFRAGDETTQELMQIDLQQKIKVGKIKDLLFD